MTSQSANEVSTTQQSQLKHLQKARHPKSPVTGVWYSILSALGELATARGQAFGNVYEDDSKEV